LSGTLESIIGVLRVGALTWSFKQIKFVAGYCGSVVENNMYPKLKKLMYKKTRKLDSLPIIWHRHVKHTIG